MSAASESSDFRPPYPACRYIDSPTFIPAGTTHRLVNPGKVPLELVEVQCGPYLGEDDIVRLEDIYGRTEGKAG